MMVSQEAFTKGLLDAQIPAPNGLTNPDGVPATKRYDVYRNNVAVSLSDALETAFPVIQKLVGEDFFRALAGVYLRTHPPKSPLMMFYGDAMPTFLKRFDPVKHLAYLPDIARLELAMRHSYHAADAQPIDGQALAEVAPDALMALRFKFAPAMHLLDTDYPIHGVYMANTQANAPKPVMRPEAVLITRPGFDPQLHLITKADAICLSSLIEGHPLGVAMTTAGESLDLGALLGLLLREGAITNLT